MATTAQIQANQVNAQNSTGPRTVEGKQRSSRNATRHGYRAVNPVLPHESQEEFDELLSAYRAQFVPTSPLLERLVFDLADAQWRLDRILRDEACLVENAMLEVETDPQFNSGDPDAVHAEALRRLAENGRTLALLQRYATQYRRQYDRALKTILDLHRDYDRRNQRFSNALLASALAPPPVPNPRVPGPGCAAFAPELRALPNEAKSAAPLAAHTDSRSTNRHPLTASGAAGPLPPGAVVSTHKP
jgi:hypothetical protein